LRDDFEEFFLFCQTFFFFEAQKKKKNIIMTFGSVFWIKSVIFDGEGIFCFRGRFCVNFRGVRLDTPKGLKKVMNLGSVQKDYKRHFVKKATLCHYIVYVDLKWSCTLFSTGRSFSVSTFFTSNLNLKINYRSDHPPPFGGVKRDENWTKMRFLKKYV